MTGREGTLSGWPEATILRKSLVTTLPSTWMRNGSAKAKSENEADSPPLALFWTSRWTAIIFSTDCWRKQGQTRRSGQSRLFQAYLLIWASVAKLWSG